MKPGPKSKKIIEKDLKIISPSIGLRDTPFVYHHGKGCDLWDEDGQKYLDFAGSIAVMNAGYGNPEIIKAIQKQALLGTHCGFSDFYAKLPLDFAEKLVTFMPRPLERVFLSNSGTESIECALKLARWHTKNRWLIAFDNCFHGRTMGSLSMTNSKVVHRERFGPFLDVEHATYPYAYRMKMEPEDCSMQCLTILEKAMKKHEGQIAGLFMEPMQGEGGYVVPPASFVKGVERLCGEHHALLISDEVQAGCFRTGKFMAISNFNVRPDIACMSKALGGGLPLGATISTSKIMDWPPGSHMNTFGGNLLACAAGMASLEYMKKKNLAGNALAMGKIIMKRLEEMKEKYEHIGDVRGMGLMIGIEIVEDKYTREPDVKTRDKIVEATYKHGLIMLPAGKSVLRISPPLVLTKEQANRGLDILEKAVKESS